ncbi:ATP-binding protein [Candidatus Micrarchaeota archaeon]|nr:ATP-binding protein [Candidatus Micrarchaeota archaeon]MBU1165679.1 ATP-binding protein [Candidatus Micrarchaeota archaeon]MBU1887358.1 ATP-binding protein [Candidatus Micrarchaeota archaeon]
MRMALAGRLTLTKISNRDISIRNILTRPPEPPLEVLFSDPTNSVYIGRTSIFNVPFYWTHKYVANPHIAIVGISGSGKSYFIKTFLLRAAFVWNSNGLIIDWAGEYKDWVKQTGGKVIGLGRGSYLNLLDLGGMKPYDRIKQVMRTVELLTDIANYPEQRRLTEQAIEKAYLENKFRMDVREQKDELGKPLTAPTLKDVVRILTEQAQMGSYEFPAELENAIYRLRQFTKPGEDFFAQQSTVQLDVLVSSGLVDLDLSGLPDETMRALAALTLLQFVKERMRLAGALEGASTQGLRLLIVLDEAWKIGKEENSDAVMIVREGRKYNFGMIIASQNPTDISEAIFSNVGTTFILKVKFERFLDYLQGSLNFSNYMREQITRLGVGQCAVNLSLTLPTPYPQTFLLEKIEGEEPSKEYFLDLTGVITDKQRRDVSMSRTVSFLKEDFRRKLRQFGLTDDKIENLSKTFEKNNRRMDVVSFIVLLERDGIVRRNLSDFLKDAGLDDITIINIFGKVDMKKSGGVGREISQVVLEE